MSECACERLTAGLNDGGRHTFVGHEDWRSSNHPRSAHWAHRFAVVAGVELHTLGDVHTLGRRGGDDGLTASGSLEDTDDGRVDGHFGD